MHILTLPLKIINVRNLMRIRSHNRLYLEGLIMTSYVTFITRLVINQLNGSVNNVFIFINILIFFLKAGEQLKQPEKM